MYQVGIIRVFVVVMSSRMQIGQPGVRTAGVARYHVVSSIGWSGRLLGDSGDVATDQQVLRWYEYLYARGLVGADTDALYG